MLFLLTRSSTSQGKFWLADSPLNYTQCRGQDDFICTYLERPRQTTAVPLFVFHRPVTSGDFHLWRQPPSVLSFHSPSSTTPFVPVCNSSLSSAHPAAHSSQVEESLHSEGFPLNEEEGESYRWKSGKRAQTQKCPVYVNVSVDAEAVDAC